MKYPITGDEIIAMTWGNIHGGHEEEHRQEMIQVATSVATQVINDYLSTIIEQKVDEVIAHKANALDNVNATFNIDIHSAVQRELNGVFKQFFHKELAAIFKKNGLKLDIR